MTSENAIQREGEMQTLELERARDQFIHEKRMAEERFEHEKIRSEEEIGRQRQKLGEA